MRTRQVPRAEWVPFFDAFTRRHEGWLATVRVIDQKIGSQVEARDLPLEGIVPGSGKGDSLSILLGKRPDANVEHPVERPEQVWVEITDRGAEAALEIISADNRRTILEFRTQALPEEVDGLVREPAAD